MMKKALCFCVIASLILAACHRGGEYKTFSQNQLTTKIYAKCPPRVVEVGLHMQESVPDKYNNSPINLLPFKSSIRIYDSSGRHLLRHTESDAPIVYWMSDEKHGWVEYIGIQEIILPRTIICKDYIFEIEHEDFPDWMINSSLDPIVYARKSRRP